MQQCPLWTFMITVCLYNMTTVQYFWHLVQISLCFSQFLKNLTVECHENSCHGQKQKKCFPLNTNACIYVSSMFNLMRHFLLYILSSEVNYKLQATILVIVYVILDFSQLFLTLLALWGGMSVKVCLSIGLPLWSRLKYLNKY